MLKFLFLLFSILIEFLIWKIDVVEACDPCTNTHYPDDCSQRDSLITPDIHNQTELTTEIYNTVYSVTRDTTAWTAAYQMAFNSYWNAIRGVIWGTTYTTTAAKIDKIVYLLNGFSANSCNFQCADFFHPTILLLGDGVWGTLGDFVACGNFTESTSTATTSTTTESTTITTTSPVATKCCACCAGDLVSCVFRNLQLNEQCFNNNPRHPNTLNCVSCTAANSCDSGGTAIAVCD